MLHHSIHSGSMKFATQISLMLNCYLHFAHGRSSVVFLFLYFWWVQLKKLHPFDWWNWNELFKKIIFSSFIFSSFIFSFLPPYHSSLLNYFHLVLFFLFSFFLFHLKMMFFELFVLFFFLSFFLLFWFISIFIPSFHHFLPNIFYSFSYFI